MKEKISGIYAIENMTNGKKYIGFSVNVKRRWNKHRSQLRKEIHISDYLQNAWSKYGEEIFKFWIIEEYPPILETLRLMEIYFIAYYDSFWEDGKGYNLTRGGGGPSSPTLITRKRMSNSHKGKSPSPEAREKQRNALLGEKSPLWGTHKTEEQKREQSIKMSGENNVRWGTKHVPETIEKMKESVKRRPPISDETRKKQSDAHIGKPSNNKGKITPPEIRKKQSNSHKKNAKKGKENLNYGRKFKNAISLYFGVYRVYRKKGAFRWIVTIIENNKRIYIGSFNSEIDTAHAYDDYIIKNNIGRPLNFPDKTHAYWEIN